MEFSSLAKIPSFGCLSGMNRIVLAIASLVLLLPARANPPGADIATAANNLLAALTP